MSKTLKSALVVLTLAAGAFALNALAADKVPKCSKPLCRDVGCAADFYCASGATIKSCAEICGH